MSAWYVWSALGMYPVTPGSDQLILGTPMFDRATVTTNKKANASEALAIVKKGPGNYIRQAHIHGKKLPPYITKEALRKGGSLVFECQDEPSEFGADSSDWPIERWNESGFIPVPVIHAPRTFKTTCTVSISTESNVPYPTQYALMSTADAAPEADEWANYTGPFAVQSSTVILARTVRDNQTSSTVQHALKQVNHAYTLELDTPLSNQYAAGGDQALIDGIEGGNQYQTGDWQGFWGTDISGVIDLKQPTQITGVRVGALRDIRPWIFLPKHVSISCSQDGRNWIPFGEKDHAVNQSDETPIRHTFEISGQTTARYIRFDVANHGLLPEGHLGAGNPSWVFLDEVSILSN
jgi:hypothetical protein